jgi:hypothetical protein
MLQFLNDFSGEQERALHEILRTSEESSDQLYPTYTSADAITRDERLTLTVNNFFQIYSDPNFRGLDYFCAYISKLDYEELEALKQLFKLMSNNIYLEATTNKSLKTFEIFSYLKGNNEPDMLELTYNLSLHKLLYEYTNQQIYVKVTLEELLKVVGDFTGYESQLAC